MAPPSYYYSNIGQQFAFANLASGTTDGTFSKGDGTVLIAITGKKLRILSAIMVTAATATNVTFNSKGSGAGTPISALFANGANGGAVLQFNPAGWFETNVGEVLTATTGSGSTTGISIVYQEI